MQSALRHLGTAGLIALGRGRAVLHGLLQARAAAAHPWLFVATATATAPTAGAMLAEAARSTGKDRGVV